MKLLLLSLSALSLYAQTLELFPFAGIMAGGKGGVFPVNVSTPKDATPDLTDLDNIGLNKSFAAGVAVSRRLSRYFDAEGTYSFQRSTAVGVGNNGENQGRVAGANLHYFQGDVLLYFNESGTRLRPYLLFGAGATVLSPRDTLHGTRAGFSGSFGGGIKWRGNGKWGIRAQFRYLPTKMYTKDNTFWCAQVSCFYVPNTAWLNQYEFAAGPVFRF